MNSPCRFRAKKSLLALIRIRDPGSCTGGSGQLPDAEEDRVSRDERRRERDSVATRPIARCRRTTSRPRCGARGVDVDAEVARAGRARYLLFDTDRHMANATVPPMFLFRDLDGNRFLIVEAA